MNILENVDLRLYSTMRLGGKTRYLAEAPSQEKIRELVNWAKDQKIEFLVIGQGSNIVWRDDGYEGLVIVNKILGREILDQKSTAILVKFYAGEVWDKCVEWTLEHNLNGLEFLSRIPGTAGAAPVQNIGAYGSELSDFFVEASVYDTKLDKFVCLMAEHCDFSYRSSRFKKSDKGRYIILDITLKLSKSEPKPPFYESLQKYFDEHGITEFAPQIIREAVTDIRKVKLPDPSIVANNGSFFLNPLIESSKFQDLRNTYPDIKAWPQKDGKIKISAGWMLEKAGFKGVHDQQTGIATWPYSALVLTNEHAKKTADLLEFKEKILSKIEAMFGIKLEQEPELLP